MREWSASWARRPPDHPSDMTSTQPDRRPTIMIVEDAPEFVQLVEASLLRGSDYHIEVATNGHDAKAPALSDTSDMGELMDEMLREKMKNIFESMGEKLPDLEGRDSEVFALALKKMADDRRTQDSKLEVLERRIARLSHNLGLTEEQLQRAMEMKGMDPGVASIYQEVQGLADGTSDTSLKKDMMAAIYEANMELQNKDENDQDS